MRRCDCHFLNVSVLEYLLEVSKLKYFECAFRELVKACGYTKATMYAVSPLMISTVKKGATKDKQKYLNNVAFLDRGSAVSENIIGVA